MTPELPDLPNKEDRGWKAYALAAAAVLLAILILQNLQEVEVRFLFVNTTIPLIFALLIVGALGALIGWAAPRVRRGGPER
ncbi:MAG: LapA family protein [Actinomycetota bacterium]|nr:LapA family protein [Actinomycetota bacterium]